MLIMQADLRITAGLVKVKAEFLDGDLAYTARLRLGNGKTVCACLTTYRYSSVGWSYVRDELLRSIGKELTSIEQEQV